MHTTRSLCPFCLRVVEAAVVEMHGAVYMVKTCPDHGPLEIYLWPSAEQYNRFRSLSFPHRPPVTQTAARSGCPLDCGLCPEHLRAPTLVEIETTQRCNLSCPVCFMSAQRAGPDISSADVRRTLRHVRDRIGTNVSLQLTGGEPTVRPDLAALVQYARELGFVAMEVNTNGINLARHPEQVRLLQEAGITGIYLQFDGLRSEVSRQLRGAELLDLKLHAISNCRAAGMPVVLAMTVVAGVNDGDVGDMLELALENLDVVCGLALQPAFESGRFDLYPERRLSMGDVVGLLARQSKGLLDGEDFWPIGCSHPLCSCGTHLVHNGKQFRPVTRDLGVTDYLKLFNPSSPQGSVFADIQALRRGNAAEFSADPSGRGLSILVMSYMDAWTMDLERLSECSMTVATPDGRIMPFCAYHLTDASGQRLYPFAPNATRRGEA